MEAFLGLVGVDAGLKAWTNCVSLFCCTKRMSCDARTRASVRDASELRELRVEQLAIGKKQELRTLLDDIMSAAKVPREVPPHDEVSFHEEVTRAVEAVRKTERVDAKEKGWNGWRSGNDCANDIDAEPVCYYFKHGKCRNGYKCPYAHPCRNAQAGKWCSKKACRFFHGKRSIVFEVFHVSPTQGLFLAYSRLAVLGASCNRIFRRIAGCFISTPQFHECARPRTSQSSACRCFKTHSTSRPAS